MKACINHHCQQSIPKNAVHCPYCGTEQGKAALSARPFYIIGIIMLLLMVALLIRNVLPPSVSQDVATAISTKQNGSAALQNPVTSTSEPFVTRTPTVVQVAYTETPTSQKATEIPTSSSCLGAPTTRIRENDLVRVVTTNRDRLVLRSQPEINNRNELQRLNYGTQLKIFDGPVCVMDPSTSIYYWFWSVKVKSTGNTGWVAEGDQALYYLEIVR